MIKSLVSWLLADKWLLVGSAVFLAFGLAAVAYASNYNNPRHWSNGEALYRIDTNSIPSTWDQEIIDAANTWELSTTPDVKQTFSGVNWIKKGYISGGAIAQVTGAITLPSHHYIWREMRFNGSKEFDVFCDDDSFDVYSIALHEFGHFVGGLSDTGESYDTDKVMYEAASYDTCFTDLHDHDIDGMNAAYSHSH